MVMMTTKFFEEKKREKEKTKNDGWKEWMNTGETRWAAGNGR